MPKPFMQYGMATHQAFDSLAAHASESPLASVERLSKILATCVACHAAYRLELK